MASMYGDRIKVSIFGQSHGESIGVVVDGLPAGIYIDMDDLASFMARRAPGNQDFVTPRKESDQPHFVSGLVNGRTCGAPLCAMIENMNVRSNDYRNFVDVPRPGHADYTAHIKYGGYEDCRGGGHFSGRLTAPLCVAGGIFLQMLSKVGIRIEACIDAIGGNKEEPLAEVKKALLEGDSVGGVVTCRISGVPAGIGEPMFGGIENKISHAIFGIPAVKGIEFGEGFAAATMRGSEHNDAFQIQEDGRVITATNHHGGILGGISSGMDIYLRVAFKPTPSIFQKQESFSWTSGKRQIISIEGRHDPCIVLRAIPCVEAACAMALVDMMDWQAVNFGD